MTNSIELYAKKYYAEQYKIAPQAAIQNAAASKIAAFWRGNSEIREKFNCSRWKNVDGVSDDIDPETNFADRTEGLAAFFDIEWKENTLNVDVGGGAYDTNTNWLATEKKVKNLVYDPFMRSRKHNLAILEELKQVPADTATSFSILNVIPFAKKRAQHIQLVHDVLKEKGVAYFKAWKADGSKVAALPGHGLSYPQNKRPIEDYTKEIEKIFGLYNVIVNSSKNLIIAIKDQDPLNRKNWINTNGISEWIDPETKKPDATEGLAAFQDVDFVKGTVNADIGGGKYDTNSKWLKEERGVTNLVYDPYMRSIEHNQSIISQLLEKKADTATSFSVLNVILDQSERKNHLVLLKNCLKLGGQAYIKVWKSSGDSVASLPRDNKMKYPQNNRPIGEYLEEVKQVFGFDQVALIPEKNLIIARNGYVAPLVTLVPNVFQRVYSVSLLPQPFLIIPGRVTLMKPLLIQRPHGVFYK